MKGLFRNEAMAAKDFQTGPIILAKPIPIKVAGWTSFLLLCASIIFLNTFSFAKTVNVTGRLAPSRGVVTIVSPQAGAISIVHAEIGKLVKVGTLLYELKSSRMSNDGNLDLSIKNSLEAQKLSTFTESKIRERQLNQLKNHLLVRKGFIVKEIESLSNEIKLRQERLAMMEIQQEKNEILKEKGFLSASSAMDGKTTIIEQTSIKLGLERSGLELHRSLDTIESEIRSIGAQIELNEMSTNRGIAEIDQRLVEHVSRTNVQIHAPLTGFITAEMGKIGQFVGAGNALASIMTQDDVMVAHLNVPSRLIGYVTTGQVVNIKVDAFPQKKFGYITGFVTKIEQTPISHQENSIGERLDEKYRVFVQMDKDSLRRYQPSKKLKAGMSVQVKFNKNKSKIIDQIFDSLATSSEKL